MSIQRQIQQLNPQIGFNVNCHSKTDSTIKPSNRIQCECHSKTDSTLNPQIGFNVNAIQRQIQQLKIK